MVGTTGPSSKLTAVSSTALEKLVEKVRYNVRPGQGVTNRMIQRFGLMVLSNDFKGVFAADCLPFKLCQQGNFMIIANTGRRKPSRDQPRTVVGHFVAIVARPGTVWYLDPYGMSCDQPDIKKFLTLCRRRVRQNRRQFQAFDSVYCGLYALLFCLLFDRVRERRGARKKFKLAFNRKKNLELNDMKCVSYLRQLI